MGVGKSNAKVYVQKETGVTFKDVAGEDRNKGIPCGGGWISCTIRKIFQNRRQAAQRARCLWDLRNR